MSWLTVLGEWLPVALVSIAAGILLWGRWRRHTARRAAPEPDSSALLDQTAELTREKEQLKGYLEEHKQIEDALRQSEEKYRVLVENANDAILIAQDGVMKFANPMTEQLVGYTFQELSAMPFTEIPLELFFLAGRNGAPLRICGRATDWRPSGADSTSRFECRGNDRDPPQTERQSAAGRRRRDAGRCQADWQKTTGRQPGRCRFEWGEPFECGSSRLGFT